MEIIDKIPDYFLKERELSLGQEKYFIEQMNRFNRLNESYFLMGRPLVDENGRVIFREGTIIHGIGTFKEETLDGISKTGILTGQAIGISEDGETYYCADFHRVKSDISVIDYSSWFPYNDGRCPFGKRADTSNSVAFVVTPNEDNRELLSYDCYRDGTLEAEITKSFINYMPIEDREIASSILYGVPYRCLEGIIVGGRVVSDREKIAYLMQKFPNSYIATTDGRLIYEPGKREYDNGTVIELRRTASALEKDKRIAYRKIQQHESEINRLTEFNDKLMRLMILNCRNEDIASVLMSMGWQGNIDDDYVENMRKGYGNR